jgi:hypothetical protein
MGGGILEAWTVGVDNVFHHVVVGFGERPEAVRRVVPARERRHLGDLGCGVWCFPDARKTAMLARALDDSKCDKRKESSAILGTIQLP